MHPRASGPDPVTLHVSSEHKFQSPDVRLRKNGIIIHIYIYTLCVRGLLRIGLLSKDLNINPGTYLGKGAAAGVQDVHSSETYHFHNFLKRNKERYQDIEAECWKLSPGAETFN